MSGLETVLNAVFSFDFEKTSSIVLLVILIQAGLAVLALLIYLGIKLHAVSAKHKRNRFFVEASAAAMPDPVEKAEQAPAPAAEQAEGAEPQSEAPAPFAPDADVPMPEAQDEVPVRVLLGIELELSAVRMDFTVGEAFDLSGLVVLADYSAEPMQEQVSDYEVDVPDMTQEGGAEVRIRYCGMEASYTIFLVRPQFD